MKNLLKIFTKEVVRPFPVQEYIIFNVTNFNNWFNDINNGASYAHSGIYLRLDKLSEFHIEEYMKLCYGIDSNTPRQWSKPLYELTREFYYKIRERWLQELNQK